MRHTEARLRPSRAPQQDLSPRLVCQIGWPQHMRWLAEIDKAAKYIGQVYRRLIGSGIPCQSSQREPGRRLGDLR
jgi:hypothetical protein